MSREIKFRAWHNPTKTMSYSIGVNEKGDTVFAYPDGKVHIYGGTDNTMQYTGLKDKNGKEIYEGDILDDGRDGYGVVAYKENMASFVCKVVGDGLYRLNEGSFDRPDKLQYTEIIGNIHENPELLESK